MVTGPADPPPEVGRTTTPTVASIPDNLIQTFSYEKNAAAGGWQNMRLNDYASSGNVLVIMGYGTSGGVNDLIGRIESMEDGAYTALGTYNYLGATMTGELELSEPDVSIKVYVRRACP